MELASAFDPPEMTGAVAMPVESVKPFKRAVVSVAYASAEYDTKGLDDTEDVVVVVVMVVVVVVAVVVVVVVVDVEEVYAK